MTEHSEETRRDGRGREGYQPSEFRSRQGDGGKRPRISRPRVQSYPNSYEGAPRARRNADDGAYERPRFQRDGYRPREHRYGDEGAGGYRPRTSYGRNGGGEGRDGDYRPQRQGFRPYQGQGGYDRNRQQRRPGYNPQAKYSLKKRIQYKEASFDPNEPVRLNRFLANAGICSRRDADKYIEAGVVKVNGEVVTELGTKVLRSDSVFFHDEPVVMEKKVYILLNKPKGYITTSDDPQQRKTVMDLVKGACPERIYPVGRLDSQTTGVLLMTNDGDLASKLTHPQFMKKKIYHVFLDKSVSSGDMQRLLQGIELEDGPIHADEVQYVSDADKKQVGIEIHSGRNRIVRRMFEALGYHVRKLDRVFFAGLTKKHLKRGDWRFLTEEEVNFLRMGSFG